MRSRWSRGLGLTVGSKLFQVGGRKPCPDDCHPPGRLPRIRGGTQRGPWACLGDDPGDRSERSGWLRTVVIERQPVRTLKRWRSPGWVVDGIQGFQSPRFQQAQPASRACARGRWPAGCRRLIAGGRLSMLVVTRGGLRALSRRERYRGNLPQKRKASLRAAGSTRPAARSLLGVPPAGGIQVTGWQSSPALGWTPGSTSAARKWHDRPQPLRSPPRVVARQSPGLVGGCGRYSDRGWPEGPPEVLDRGGNRR
jgi:hypothetical protein